MSPFNLEPYLTQQQRRVDSLLEQRLARLAKKTPPRLAEAMCYSLVAGGKRLRPILCLAFAEVAKATSSKIVAEDAAVALEFIHTYSLIHDDLPAMDDDDMRRGRPSSHRKFGEALAILAGDALLTDAFSVITEGN